MLGGYLHAPSIARLLTTVRIMKGFDMKNRRQIILDNVHDLVGALMYYDRKEREDLTRGSIEQAVDQKEITVDEMVEEFSRELRKNFT